MADVSQLLRLAQRQSFARNHIWTNALHHVTNLRPVLGNSSLDCLAQDVLKNSVQNLLFRGGMIPLCPSSAKPIIPAL